MNNILNLAFIGLGDHAVRAHLAHLKTFSDVSLAGVFDPNNASVVSAERSQDVQLPRYESETQLLSDPRVDGVIISSPDKFHLPQLQAAVKAGKHVFCEKPLCTVEQDVGDLKKVLLNAEQGGLVVTSCHPRRFDPPYLWLKNNFSDLASRLGQPLSLALDFSYHQPDPTKRHLHGDSLLQDHANHEIDYVHFLFGLSPTTVFRKLDSHDRYEMSGVRADGITFEFSGTRRLENSIYPETIRMRFERGDLVIDTYEEANSHIRFHDRVSHRRGKGTSNSVEPVYAGITSYNERFIGINRAFVDAVKGGCPNYLTPQEMVINTLFSTALQRDPIYRFELGAAQFA